VGGAVAQGSAKDAADAARRALGNDAAIFTEESELVAPVTIVMTLIAADELALARHAAKRAVEIAREQGATTALVRALTLSSIVGFGEGDLISAEPDIRQAVELSRSAGSAPMALAITPLLVEILIERDELLAAERELETTGMADGPIPRSPMFTLLFFARGHLRLERGEVEAALEDFEGLSYKEERLDFGHLTAAYAAPLLARALRAAGETPRARDLVDTLEALARRWGSPSSVVHMLRTRATAGSGEEAIRDLKEAVTLLADSPRRLERAHALVDLGEVLRREGCRTDSRTPLREALELARRCGAGRIAKRAHDELLASGETVRRYTPIGVESLTPSERRVAELAASGMTNRQIAQSLFVTVKTVEAHLSAAYDKLDIESRRQLPGALAR
jgi:ATP/maltotriose-dependent transcriptional regulator MalT